MNLYTMLLLMIVFSKAKAFDTVGHVVLLYSVVDWIYAHF